MDIQPDKSAYPEPTDAWARFGLPGFGDGGAAYGQAVVQEMTQFLARRLRADADALTALGACTRPAEVMEVQQRWFVEMGQAYSGAAARVMCLGLLAGPQEATPSPTAGATATPGR